MFRGGELTRLLVLVLMLFILFTMISRLRMNPNMLAWMVPESTEDRQVMHHPPQPAEAAAEKPAEKPAAKPAEKPAAKPAGETAVARAEPPLDEDPEEIEAIKEEFQAVTDGRISREIVEMAAYQRLMRWARNQSWEPLTARAKKGFVYTDFMQSPDSFRGKLVTMKLEARRILACPAVTDPDDPAEKLTLYEVWGFSKESRSFPYVFVVLDLPEGMPYGPNVEVSVRATGYFFGLQGYMSSFSKPGSAPLRAPMFIGRMQWIKDRPVQLTQTDWSLVWIAGGVVVLIVAGTVGYMALCGRRKPPVLAGDRVVSGELTVDHWLQRAEHDADPVEFDRNEADDV
jgi:hypothetical protein